jgi:hypothetical protein
MACRWDPVVAPRVVAAGIGFVVASAAGCLCAASFAVREALLQSAIRERGGSIPRYQIPCKYLVPNIWSAIRRRRDDLVAKAVAWQHAAAEQVIGPKEKPGRSRA